LSSRPCSARPQRRAISTILALLGRERRLREQLRHAEDRVQRRAHLVAHRRDERALRAHGRLGPARARGAAPPGAGRARSPGAPRARSRARVLALDQVVLRAALDQRERLAGSSSADSTTIGGAPRRRDALEGLEPARVGQREVEHHRGRQRALGVASRSSAPRAWRSARRCTPPAANAYFATVACGAESSTSRMHVIRSCGLPRAIDPFAAWIEPWAPRARYREISTAARPPLNAPAVARGPCGGPHAVCFARCADGRRRRRPRILIVEDDVDSWNLIQRAVHEALPDAAIQWASDSRARARARELPVRCVIADYMLADESNGWRVLHECRRLQPDAASA
jgi:hypothetical protein